MTKKQRLEHKKGNQRRKAELLKLNVKRGLTGHILGGYIQNGKHTPKKRGVSKLIQTALGA